MSVRFTLGRSQEGEFFAEGSVEKGCEAKIEAEPRDDGDLHFRLTIRPCAEAFGPKTNVHVPAKDVEVDEVVDCEGRGVSLNVGQIAGSLAAGGSGPALSGLGGHIRNIALATARQDAPSFVVTPEIRSQLDSQLGGKKGGVS